MGVRALLSSIVALALFAGPSQAAILFTDLGTDPPPATIGSVPVTPFDLAPQAAIPDGTIVFAIPGDPFGGPVAVSLDALRLTVPDSWLTWSHGYVGPVFAFPDNVTLLLPFPTRAFYVYVEPNFQDVFTVSATANDGTTSGPIDVNGDTGANGFGF
ncbi:MAG TPA: hypothetical protein VMS64_13965, partial [Candidatus Methylomirabilis sp.]|nr:hypothetical protein [Candidatus Methylomirabilis sp.]